MRVLEGTSGPVRCLAYSPDGRTLAASWGRMVELWNVEEFRLRAGLLNHHDGVSSLAFSPDGRTLASASLDGTVRLWDADDGRPRACFDWEVGPIHCVGFAPDEMTIAAGGDSGLVVWDLDEPGSGSSKRGCPGD